MIDLWLDSSTVGILAGLAGFYGLTGAVVIWLCFGRPWRAWAETFSGVVAPFFSAVAILFALLTSVLASDIGQRNRQAAQAVGVEAAAAGRVNAISVAAVADMAGIKAMLEAYLRSAVADEWPVMAEGEASDRTGALLASLLREVTHPKIAVEAGSAVQAALVDAVAAMGSARSERLAAGADGTNELKWATVLLLGVFVQLALGLVHLARWRPLAAALTVFSAAAVATLGLLAFQERPYSGAIQVKPMPLVRAADLVLS